MDSAAQQNVPNEAHKLFDFIFIQPGENMNKCK